MNKELIKTTSKLPSKSVKYSQKIVDSICEDLALGKSLRNVLSPTMKNRPCWQSLRKWFKKYPEVRKQYEEAKQDGIDYELSKAQSLLDQTLEDARHSDKVDLGKTHLIKEYLSLAKWRAERLQSKVYGKQTELNARVGDELIQIKWAN